MELIDFLTDLKARFPSQINFEPGLNRIGDDIPDALKDFYKFSNGGSFQFGSIFDLNQAKEKSKRPPFCKNWFFFGYDNYFTYWVCKYSPDNGLWFTTWDHESGNDIEEPVWKNLGDFLQEMLEEYEES